VRATDPTPDGHIGPLLDGARGSRFLRNLPDEDLAAVLGIGRLLDASPRKLLSRRGSDSVLLLLTGAAKDHRTTSSGEDVVLRLIAPGDVAGVSGALGTPADGDVTALTPAAAIILPGHKLRALARSRPPIALVWLQTVTEQLSMLRHQVLAFASTSSTQRIIYRLTELADRFGEPVNGEIRIRAQLPQAELASWAGTSRESVARALHDLRCAGILATDEGR
jgi:CRP/FNR family transcriptional regulator, cyclic AMP receptor protein